MRASRCYCRVVRAPREVATASTRGVGRCSAGSRVRAGLVVRAERGEARRRGAVCRVAPRTGHPFKEVAPYPGSYPFTPWVPGWAGALHEQRVGPASTN
eukprot:447627-Prymnesium_polylepis.1